MKLSQEQYEKLKAIARRKAGQDGEDALHDALVAELVNGNGREWHEGRRVLEVKSRARNRRRSDAARVRREQEWAFTQEVIKDEDDETEDC